MISRPFATNDSARTVSNESEDGGAWDGLSAGVGCSAGWWLARTRCALPTSTSPSWAPSITGSHCSGKATPSSFSTRSPARSVAIGSSDPL
eukprot:scaffold143773_cov133-Phaeocystis_antarctica.AAC.1